MKFTAGGLPGCSWPLLLPCFIQRLLIQIKFSG
jgi:hypothetical protein